MPEKRGRKKYDITGFMFRIRSEEIKKRPKTKYYWEIIRDRTVGINSLVKRK